MKKWGGSSLEARREMILHGNIPKTLLFLSIPTLLMGLVQALIPLCDGLFLNRSAGYLVAGAVGFVQPMINILNAFSQGLGVAAMALIGQMYGRGDVENVRKTSLQIIVVGFLAGIAMAPVALVLARSMSTWVNPQISHHVFLYTSLYSVVLPFLFLAAIYNSMKNATGQPEATFVRMILLLIFKIVFNYIFLTVLDFQIVGAVLASLISYVLIGAWMYYDLFVREGPLKMSLKEFSFDRSILRELLDLGIPSILSFVMVNIGFFLINMEVEKYGPYILTAQSIVSNITNICFLVPSSIGTTVTTMVSMNMGLGQSEKAKRSFMWGCAASLLIAVVLIAVVLPNSHFLITLFQTDPKIVTIADESLHIYTFSVIGFGIFMVVQGAFIGMGRTKMPLVTGILRVWLLRYVFIKMTAAYLGVYAVFWGNLFSNYVAAMIFFIIILRTPWTSAIRPGHSDR